MSDSAQLPYLLALVDDESRMVRDSVLSKLAEFGSDLEAELRRLENPPNEGEVARLRHRVNAHRNRVDAFTDGTPVGEVIGKNLFQPGQLVRHRRYGYRGVIVDFDLTCQAGEAWYRQNRTQPDRDQPWYHVLVHGQAVETYAAQSSLQDDDVFEPVDHPLVREFFADFDGVCYLRNARPWPQA